MRRKFVTNYFKKKPEVLELRVYVFVAIINTNHQRKNVHNKNLKYFYYIDGGAFALLHSIYFLTFFWLNEMFHHCKFHKNIL
jgi:hypothetical protein